MGCWNPVPPWMAECSDIKFRRHSWPICSHGVTPVCGGKERGWQEERTRDGCPGNNPAAINPSFKWPWVPIRPNLSGDLGFQHCLGCVSQQILFWSKLYEVCFFFPSTYTSPAYYSEDTQGLVASWNPSVSSYNVKVDDMCRQLLTLWLEN